MPLLTSFLWREKLVSKIIFCLAKIAISLYFSGAPSRIRTECEPRRTEKKVCVILEGCRFLRYQNVLTKKVYQNDTPLGATSDKVSEPTTSPSWCGLYADANLF